MIRLHSALVSIATLSSRTSAVTAIDRTLQSSILCIASGINFNDCCPTGADPYDGACTLLSCINFESVTIHDDCDCGQIEVACGQVAIFADLVANLSEMCIAVDNCCANSTLYSKTSNQDFDGCMATTMEESDVALPDIDAILPVDGMSDGVQQDKNIVSMGGTTTAATMSTASKVTTITNTMASTSTVTRTPVTSSAPKLISKKTVELAGDTNDAPRFLSRAYLIGFPLALLLV